MPAAGYGSPSSFATLSNASPAASSRVRAEQAVRAPRSTSTSSVWPPETSSAVNGGTASRCSSAVANRWPSMWCTPTSAASRAERERLGEAHADEQRADEPGRVRDGDRVDVA